MFTIISEADQEDYVTTLRCPEAGWTFRVVWHCPVDNWKSPFARMDGYAIYSVQIKDIIANNNKDFLLAIIVCCILIMAILGACAIGLI